MQPYIRINAQTIYNMQDNRIYNQMIIINKSREKQE